jgi:hypothetical protein
VNAATSFQGRYTITNLAAREANDIVVTIDVPADLAATAFSLPNAACAQQASVIQCTLPALAAGAAADGTITLLAQGSAGGTLRARASGNYIDPVSGNDSSEQAIVITTTPVTIQSSSSGGAGGGGSGGGGSTGLGLLLALSALRLLRRQSPLP